MGADPKPSHRWTFENTKGAVLKSDANGINVAGLFYLLEPKAGVSRVSTKEVVSSARLRLNLPVKRRMLFGRSAWCATRSQKFVEGASLAAPMLLLSFFSEAAQFFGSPRQLFLPGGFVPQGSIICEAMASCSSRGSVASLRSASSSNSVMN